MISDDWDPDDVVLTTAAIERRSAALRERALIIRETSYEGLDQANELLLEAWQLDAMIAQRRGRA